MPDLNQPQKYNPIHIDNIIIIVPIILSIIGIVLCVLASFYTPDKGNKTDEEYRKYKGIISWRFVFGGLVCIVGGIFLDKVIDKWMN